MSLVPRPAFRFLTSILIVKPLNIILTKDRPRLHLNNLKDFVTGVRQTMHIADRDIKRLIRFESLNDIFAGNFSYPAHNHPVFGTVLVTLQGEAGTWSHSDPLDEIPDWCPLENLIDSEGK